MVTFNVHGKEYKVVFGYGLLTKTDVLDKVQGITDGKERSLQKMISLLPELLLAGLQKKHKDEFGYESDSEKKAVLDKVCDLLDDYEDEGTEENPKSGFDLYQLLDKELEKNGFAFLLDNTIGIDSFVKGINRILLSIGSGKQLNAERVNSEYRREVMNYSLSGKEITSEINYDILEANIVAKELREIGYELICLFNGFDNNIKTIIRIDRITELKEIEAKIKHGVD